MSELTSYISSIISSLVEFYDTVLSLGDGNATMADLERIDIIIRKASKVIRILQPNVDYIYKGLLSIKLSMAWIDTQHPLHVYLHNNIILRGSGRLLLPPLETNRHENSCIPRAMKLCNDSLCR